MKNCDRKLVIFDIDGTLMVEGEHYIPESAINAVKLLKENGFLTAIATGRTMEIIPSQIFELQFDYYIVANGSAIYSKDFELIYKKGMDKETTLKLISLFSSEKRALILRYFSGKCTVYNYDNMESFRQRYHNHRKVYETVDINVELPHSAVCLTESAEDITKSGFENLDFYNIFDKYYDIVVKGVNKATTTAHLAEMLDMSKKDMIFFGDGENDIPMTEAVGFTVAMQNGNDKLKEKADYVTDSFTNDGVEKAVRLILSKGEN